MVIESELHKGSRFYFEVLNLKEKGLHLPFNVIPYKDMQLNTFIDPNLKPMNTMTILLKSLVLFSLMSCSAALYPQSEEFLEEVPETEEEYAASKQRVINTINWLDQTAINEDVDKRREQTLLFIDWMNGSPSVTITINSSVAVFTKINPELLVTFMGGWAKYTLENDYDTDEVKCNLAGIKSVIAFYKNGNGLKKDKKVEKLVKMNEAELEAWVKKYIGK